MHERIRQLNTACKEAAAQRRASAAAKEQLKALEAMQNFANEMEQVLGPDKIKLEAIFDHQAGLHMMESKLSPDHTAEVMKDGRIRVKATVADSDELRWWLRGFGGEVEVRKPKGLVQP